MREMIIVFEGHEDSEKKAADTIQSAIFNALGQERMTIRQFTNQPVNSKKLVIGSPEQLKKELEVKVPDFLQNYGSKEQKRNAPLKQ